MSTTDSPAADSLDPHDLPAQPLPPQMLSYIQLVDDSLREAVRTLTEENTAVVRGLEAVANAILALAVATVTSN